MSGGGKQGHQLALRYASQQAEPHVDNYYHSSHVSCLSPQLLTLHGCGVASSYASAKRQMLQESLRLGSDGGHDPLKVGPAAFVEPLHSTWSTFSDSEQLLVAANKRGSDRLVHSCSWRHRRPELSCREHNHRRRYVGEHSQQSAEVEKLK